MQANKGYTLSREQLAYLTKEHEIKNNIVGTGFTDPFGRSKTRVNYIGQIIKAEGFESDKINISYKLVMPPNWEIELPPKHFEEEDVDLLEFNRLESMTQDCKGKIVLNKTSGLYEYVYNFAFPLDFQLVNLDNNFHKRGPTMIMQICYDDSWGRFVLEGYAFCDFPRKPGRYVLECQAWKPFESLSSQIKSFFVGGAVKVSDLADVAALAVKEGGDPSSVMNRYSLKTLSTGKVFIELNVCFQNYEFLKEMKVTKDKTKEDRDIFAENEIYKAEQQRELLGPELMHNQGENLLNRHTSPPLN